MAAERRRSYASPIQHDLRMTLGQRWFDHYEILDLRPRRAHIMLGEWTDLKLGRVSSPSQEMPARLGTDASGPTRTNHAHESESTSARCPNHEWHAARHTARFVRDPTTGSKCGRLHRSSHGSRCCV